MHHASSRAAGRRIFPNTQPGREEFVIYMIAAPRFVDMRADLIKRGQERLCAFWTAASQGGKDALCTGTGQAAGCLLCQ